MLRRCPRVLPLLLGALIACLWLLAGACPARAEDKVFNSRLVTVFHQNDEQLRELAEKIMPSATRQALDQIFLGSSASGGNDLAEFLDNLFLRVQRILDMPIPKMRVKLKLYSGDDLYAAFVQNQGGPTALQSQLGVNKNLPAFYMKKDNTIHLRTDNLRVGILAHEMAHVVTSHYFVIMPPARVAELMSQFVDQQITSGRY